MLLVFHKSFLLICLVSVLLSDNPPHVWRCQQIGKNIFLPNHLVLSGTVLSIRNGNKFKDSTVQGTLWFGASWGILPSTNLVHHADYSSTPLRFFFLLFFYISLFWNLEIFLCCFLLSILSILLLFSTLLSAPCSVFSLSVYSLYLLIHFIDFFSNLLSFLFFSLSYYSVLSASPLYSINIQSVLFLLEPSNLFLLFSLYSFFLVKDLTTLPVVCSYLSLYSLSLCSLSILFMLPFCSCFSSFLFALVFFSFSVFFSPLFYMLLLFLLLILFYILSPSFFIYFYFYFPSFLIFYFYFSWIVLFQFPHI